MTTFKIFCRASEDYCATIRDNNVVLGTADPDDECQHWYKDMKHGDSVCDEEREPAFALVNKATGQAIQSCHGRAHPVKLANYSDDMDPEDSMLWTESNDDGDGFHCIRLVNNINLGFDALYGVEQHGGVQDATFVGLWEWNGNDNQCWKIVPWEGEADAERTSDGPYILPAELAERGTVRIFCKANEDCSVTVRDGSVCLAPTDPWDDYQHWVKDTRYSEMEDEEGCPAFALVNKATCEAIKHSLGQSDPVKLVPYDTNGIDESVLWTESNDVGDGFRCIRMLNDITLNFDALHDGDIGDGTQVVARG